MTGNQHTSQQEVLPFCGIRIRVLGTGREDGLAMPPMTMDAPYDIDSICLPPSASELELHAATEGVQMVFIPVLLDGNGGAGAAPLIAHRAKERGLLTVLAAVTVPADTDDVRRWSDAKGALLALERSGNAVIVMRYARVVEVLGGGVAPEVVLAHAGTILQSLLRDIARAINVPGQVGVDFEDLRTVLEVPGKAVIGSALARGPDRARAAAEKAVTSPLLDGADLRGAQAVLVLISGAGENFRLSETRVVMDTMRAFCTPEMHMIFGTTHDNTLGVAMRVTVMAAGLP